MNKKTLLSCISILILIGISACSRPQKASDSLGVGESQKVSKSAAAHGAPHWSYHGEEGPEHWGSLDPAFSTCSKGKQQSPIDLKWRAPASERKIQFEYRTGPLAIIDNGHTVQVDFKNNGSFVLIEGNRYDLLQMHFHEKSEHTLSGKYFPMELHLVHKNGDGKLAVIGVMLKESPDNRPHPELEKILSNLPKEKNALTQIEKVTLQPQFFLPQRTTHYHYTGSLTTPPCSEGVNWNVMNTPIEVSKSQLEIYRKLYSGTNRPVQPWHSREPANY